MEMGIIGGADLEVVRVAPLGDPMQIQVLGYRLAIRRSEAARVDVLP
jgi:Fe2+ transport system protein FeoA